MRSVFIQILIFAILLLSGCETTSNNSETQITLAAAASMKNVFENELIPAFQSEHNNITVIATYDASGKLQTQIEEGADVDVFFSAALKQMNALVEKNLIANDSYTELLENQIVLIVPINNMLEISTFEDLPSLEHVAIGDPDSVPAGQYAKELLTNLNLWSDLESKLSLGTNVTEVLNWVAEGSADAGIVYATDAASNPNVKVIAAAPNASVSKVIYPVGIIKNSASQEAANLFIDFLKSEDAAQAFQKFGFTPLK
jgi:molybdate transport system substrate-binding protein